MTPLKGDGLSGRMVDVVFGEPVGRVCKAWGTDDRKKRAERKQLLFDLWDFGQTDVLIAFKQGDRSWHDLLRAKRSKQLSSATLPAELLLDRPLFGDTGAFATVLPKMGKSDQSRDRYKSALRALETTGAASARSVGALSRFDWAIIWHQLQALSPASRNRVRSAVSAFLSVYLGDKYHPFRRQLVKLMGTMEAEGSAVPRTVTPDEFGRILQALPEPVVPCALTLAATGLRVAEYLQCGATSLRRFPIIEFPDGKGGSGTVAVDPKLEATVRQAIPCALGPAPEYNGTYPGVQFDRRYKVLYREIVAAGKRVGVVCTPHYLRHLFAAIATQKTDAIRGQHALRHKTPGVTAHYAKEKSGQAVADAVGKRLRTIRDSVRDRARREDK